jgi:hypothetical protein
MNIWEFAQSEHVTESQPRNVITSRLSGKVICEWTEESDTCTRHYKTTYHVTLNSYGEATGYHKQEELTMILK